MTAKNKEFKLVQMNMREETLEEVENLKEMLHTDNRSNIIKTAISTMDLVAKAMSEGSSVIIEDKRGNRRQIIIPGIAA
jgi:hypothetical protein